ncbi:hypothetical protein HFP15_37925 [Amycolatopsis sp. K13G38]|uniref:Uncharacterized protein n=1 Tax=Amycolatopsis acididurans TaxID=2724524 RepID=A0ABX1JFX3_9PSEU|nr:hypothetical protein [Amycolatopsis acididurans]NKQ58638.1 hypothetical protein [Amycolatopsis acididurans]
MDRRNPDQQTHRPDDAASPEEQRRVIRGEQGTSSADPHDDTDPQSGLGAQKDNG